MRSFIKSHKRESSSHNVEGLLPSDFDYEPHTVTDDLNSILPPSSSTSIINSPKKSASSSPTVNKGKKLQRLFQRSKNTSPNLLNYQNGLSPVSDPKKSPPPSIIGTRTHEWGSSRRSLPSSLNNRASLNSIQSSVQSLSSASEINLAPVPESISKSLEEPSFLQLPINTVLEIPAQENEVTEAQKKNIHRRAQIVTTDVLLQLAEADGKRAFSEDNKEGEDEEESDSEGSEFSFEQNNITGRNSSIRYYKSASEQNVSPAMNQQYQQGFYVNDLVDDNFDEDMNYFDENDDFNDDEELFNRNYFGDDFTSAPESESHTATQIERNTSSTPQESTFLNQVGPSKSLKYHQIPHKLDREFSEKRYSWLSDEVDPASEMGNFSRDDDPVDDMYEAVLDEVNVIPEHFDFEPSAAPLSKARSLNSSLKRTKNVLVDSTPLNNKIITSSKTVTLFNHSSENQRIDNIEQKFGYLTPNSSFTTPNPSFVSKNVDLSPISEGSFDGSP